MIVIDIYDFDENRKERYKRTDFYEGVDKYFGKSHEFSYLGAREMLERNGFIMGLEKDIGFTLDDEEKGEYDNDK